MDKHKCDDIFKNTVINNDLRMYPVRTQDQFVDIKIKKIKKMLILQNINLVQGLRCAKGILFIRLMLKRIKIAKQLFTFEIEH